MHRIHKPKQHLVYNTNVFDSQLNRISLQFPKGTQQDCSEFLLSLFNHAQEPSIFSEVFEFCTQRVSHCGKCNSSTHTAPERQKIFECPVPRTSCELANCLDNYFRKELLRGENAYYCNACMGTQNGDTKLEICTIPQVALICLKRFQANGGKKLQSAVTFKESLNFSKWSSGSCPDKDLKKQTIYHLFTVITHCGSMLEQGHYLCYLRNGLTTEWFEANDESLKKVSWELVKRQEAYLLCYVRSDLSGSPTVNNTDEEDLPRMKSMTFVINLSVLFCTSCLFLLYRVSGCASTPADPT